MIAMHAPDGFLEPGVALATAVISLIVIGVVLRGLSDDPRDTQVPLAGMAAAFLFAAQMINFPVLAGTSGHLIGGALAAVLLGPRVGVVVMTVVVVVQALLFADGGVTALGYNTLNLAIVPVFGGWALFGLFRRVLPSDRGGVIGATALASGVSVVLAAAMFSLQWLFGASAPVPFDTVFGAMVGVHVFVGVGEGVISAVVVAAVLAARPDLVSGARDLDAAQLSDDVPVGTRTFVMAAVLVAVFVAMVVSQFASGDPDGLERVAEDHGFADAARDHVLANGLFAEYATRGIDNETFSLAIAGLTGVAVTLLVGAGVVSATREARARLPR